MKPEKLLIAGLILFSWPLHACYGLIGYDCGGAATNITTVSLLEVGECNIPEQEVNITRTHVQLIQINQYTSIHVLQCKVEIYREVTRCGMWSHGMDVPNGKYSYIDSVSRDACRRMYQDRKIAIGNTLVDGISPNHTTSRPIIIAGSISANSECVGVSYSDPYGNYDKVYVTGHVKISLRDYTAQVDVETDKVHLRSGTSCTLSESHCTDIDGGDTFWDPLPEDSCKSNRYGLLYEGYADKVTDINTNFRQTVYSMTEGDVVFALTAKERNMVCGYVLIQTEHPKLLIIETTVENPFIRKNPIAVENLDIFAYVNSKFVYVEKHIRTELKQMYRDILIQRCNLERRMLQNTLSIARQTPAEFAYNLMKKPGYMGLLAGEVAHIVKCIPVEVKIMRTKECYNELPVSRGNFTFHLTPRTHILTRTGTQITCNRLVAPMYRLDGEWYTVGPLPVRAMPPTVMQPLSEPTWTYTNPHKLATSGIYTQGDLDELRTHIMFPAERPAILNSVARGIAGQPTITQGGSISNLLDENSVNKLIEGTWKKTWGTFTTFGNISAGLIGIFMIIKVVKLALDTIIHGYALHTVYGWSIYLIGALWDSVTSLLLHLSQRPPNSNNENTRERTQGNDNNKPDGPSFYGNSSAPNEELPFEPLPYGYNSRIRDPQERTQASRNSVVPLDKHTRHTLPAHFNFINQQTDTLRPLTFVWTTETSPEPIHKSHYNTLPKPRPVTIPERSHEVKERTNPETTPEPLRKSYYNSLPKPRSVTIPKQSNEEVAEERTNSTTPDTIPITVYPNLSTMAEIHGNTPPTEGNSVSTESHTLEKSNIERSYFSLEKRHHK